jgi:2-succinyl-6-hydroxy-2,4-cyclohexadiene-1-carboxylate synthase
MGASVDWSTVVEQLAPSFNCLAVDLPGHGASREWPKAQFTIDATAQALADVLDNKDVDCCAVVGYSMGGRLALYFALHFPERCTQLVLESASPGLATPAERVARRNLDEEHALRLETDGFDEFLRDWYQQELFSSLAQHDGLVDAMITARRQNNPHALAQSLRGMGTGRQPSLWERLVALQVPTLAIAGALDAKYVVLAHQMAARSTQLQTSIVPDAGHNVHAEQPSAFLDLIVDFLHN